MTVFNCILELQDEENVVYHDIHKQPRPGKISVNDSTKRLLRRFNYWVSKDKLNEREDLELLGLCLYDLLLPPMSNIRREFESNYEFVTSSQVTPGSRLRLTLVFHTAAGELANYPWEFLHMPLRERTANQPKRDGFFLAGQKVQLILTRFMPNVEHKIGTIEKELRILVVYSHPDDPVLADINTKDTEDAIATIKALHKPPSVQVRIIETPTYEELNDALNKPDEKSGEPAFRPHIIHFIGHGDSTQGLALKMTQKELDERKAEKRPYKETAWQDSKTICDLFSDDPPPRLVFLHACEGARPGTLESFSDLARTLVLAKIPAVIAMQYAIKTGDAAVFAHVFYTKLSSGSAIDEAVRAGREALGNPDYGGKGSWSDRRFGTPVVYLQSEQAIIEMPTPFDPDKKVPCPNPRCDGRIPLEHKFCLVCDHEVMLCPNCQSNGEYFLMDKIIGRCGKCGHRLPERQASLPATSSILISDKTAEAQVAEAQSNGQTGNRDV